MPRDEGDELALSARSMLDAAWRAREFADLVGALAVTRRVGRLVEAALDLPLAQAWRSKSLVAESVLWLDFDELDLAEQAAREAVASGERYWQSAEVSRLAYIGVPEDAKWALARVFEAQGHYQRAIESYVIPEWTPFVGGAPRFRTRRVP